MVTQVEPSSTQFHFGSKWKTVLNSAEDIFGTTAGPKGFLYQSPKKAIRLSARSFPTKAVRFSARSDGSKSHSLLWDRPGGNSYSLLSPPARRPAIEQGFGPRKFAQLYTPKLPRGRPTGSPAPQIPRVEGLIFLLVPQRGLFHTPGESNRPPRPKVLLWAATSPNA